MLSYYNVFCDNKNLAELIIGGLLSPAYFHLHAHTCIDRTIAHRWPAVISYMSIKEKYHKG